MAPEIICGKGYNCLVDLWSIGICLYEFMCGMVPFGEEAEDPYEIYEEIIKKDITYPNYLKDKKAKKLMDQGVLVPDEVVIGMIESKLDANPTAKGFIFDGFPRTTAQAAALDNLLLQKNTTIKMMLALEVTEVELSKRLLLRGKDSGRPDDQNPEIIKKRINEYNNKTAPVAEYYRMQKKYYGINGIGSIDEIFSLLCKAIDK